MIIDMFSGCGGFSLGARQAGWDVGLSIDIDPDLTASYRLNFPKTNVLNKDIRTFDTKRAWNKVLNGKNPTGIIGGPPCQGFSNIGKRDLSDDRNSLVEIFFSQVNLLRPLFFVMENVTGILEASYKAYLDDCISLVSKDYEIVGPLTVSAKYYGAPTVRTRVIIVGYNSKYVNPITEQELLGNRKQFVTVKEAISDLPLPQHSNLGGYGWGSYNTHNELSNYAKQSRKGPTKKSGMGWDQATTHLKNEIVSGNLATNHTPEVEARFLSTPTGKSEKVSRYPKLNPEGLCPTLRAGTGKERGSFQSMRPIHYNQPRVITVREAARLQGFPDWFTFHPTKWHSFRMIGNSVSPLLSRHIMKTIRSKIEL